MVQTKFVFVTGGVVSSVGKGIVVSSIGRILKNRGISVSVLKLDPYLNVDPGTMSPYQHGEVFVTADGSETDLDLGHYERFIDIELSRDSNLTAGQIYVDVIAKERKGEFLGGTIQVVPHVTNAIKERILSLAQTSQAEVVIVEVGGTVGDIEGLPFLEAIRQMRNEVGRDSVFYTHLTFLPFINSTGELKTKPTQHSVRELRSIGIQPDAIVCRSDVPVTDDIPKKISVHCDVTPEEVITLPTLDSVYEVPIVLEKSGLGELIINRMGLEEKDHNAKNGWDSLVELISQPKEKLEIAVVGKYVDLPDSYMSVKEALVHAGISNDRDISFVWVSAEDITEDTVESFIGSVQGIVVPGGFGPRGIEGMIIAARYAREKGIPYFGLCLGLQVMVIEAARNVLGLKDANSAEFDPESPHPVVDIMPEQREIDEMGGTMRLGLYPCDLIPGSKAALAYGVESIDERHRHRFEINNQYLVDLEKAGFVPSGISPNRKLVEIIEDSSNEFMIGVQFHPEFLSRPGRPHPLFNSFIRAASKTIVEGSQYPLNGTSKR